MTTKPTFNSPIFSKKLLGIYNKTCEKICSDFMESYEPENNLYGPHDIQYTYNNEGFRCDEFTIESPIRIVFLGCSITEGIGVRQEETWAWQLLNTIKKDIGHDIPYWNLGVGGSGFDSITRMYYHFHNILKPQIVFGFFPRFRKEMFFKNTWDLRNGTLQENKELQENYLLWDTRYIAYENEKNFAFIDMMLQKNNSIMIWKAWGDYYPNNFQYEIKSNFIFDNLGRDKMHPGPSSHKNFADEIYSEYKNLILDKIKPLNLK